MRIDELTRMVIGACFKVHSRVGSGCLEKVYEELLHYELCLLALDVLRQQTFPVKYDHLVIPNGFRLDLFVNLQLPLEIKAVHPLAPIHFDQIRSRLALLNLKNGMLLNFKTPHMKHGIHRIFNNPGQDLLNTDVFPLKITLFNKPSFPSFSSLFLLALSLPVWSHSYNNSKPTKRKSLPLLPLMKSSWKSFA